MATKNHHNVYIMSATRSPIGALAGSLSQISAVDLATATAKSAITKAKIPAAQIDAVYFGQVLTANCGQNPARQIALGAGLSSRVPCTTVNKVCASSMKAITICAQDIALSIAEIGLVGGVESMSNAPHLLPQLRAGVRMGQSTVKDCIMQDGLLDAGAMVPMGVFAEKCATKYGVSREMQDEYCVMSYERSKSAIKHSHNEITAITVTDRRGRKAIVDSDEEISRYELNKVASARPAFDKKGTVYVSSNLGLE